MSALDRIVAELGIGQWVCIRCCEALPGAWREDFWCPSCEDYTAGIRMSEPGPPPPDWHRSVEDDPSWREADALLAALKEMKPE